MDWEELVESELAPYFPEPEELTLPAPVLPVPASPAAFPDYPYFEDHFNLDTLSYEAELPGVEINDPQTALNGTPGDEESASVDTEVLPAFKDLPNSISPSLNSDEDDQDEEHGDFSSQEDDPMLGSSEATGKELVLFSPEAAGNELMLRTPEFSETEEDVPMPMLESSEGAEGSSLLDDEEEKRLIASLVMSIDGLGGFLDSISLHQRLVVSDIKEAIFTKKRQPASKTARSERLDRIGLIKCPYIKTGGSREDMAAPPIHPGVDLPFDLRKKTKEWSPTQMYQLELAVRKSFCSRKVFFIESSFDNIFAEIGMPTEYLILLEQRRLSFEKKLWSFERTAKNLRSKESKNRMKKLLRSWLKKEKRTLATGIDEYKTGPVLRPFVVLSADNQVKVTVAPENVIAARQYQLKTVYLERIYEGPIEIDGVDWLMVAKDMTKFLKAHQKPETLRNFYRICVDKAVNRNPMTQQELKKLKSLTRLNNRRKAIDWPNVVQKLGTNRSALNVFHAYIKNLAPRTNPWLSKEGPSTVRNLVTEHNGNFGKVASELFKVYGDVKIRMLRSNWRSIDPGNACGRFLPCEDALLLVALNLHGQEYFEHGFARIRDILPWRHCSTWRYRSETLLDSHIRPWTLEEDKILLTQYKNLGRSWAQYKPFLLNRAPKTCASRYRRLKKNLRNGLTIEEYHLRYSERLAIPALKKFLRAADVFESVIVGKLDDEPKFSGFLFDTRVECDFDPIVYSRDPPNEEQMIEYLKNFDVDILISTYQGLFRLLCREFHRNNVIDEATLLALEPSGGLDPDLSPQPEIVIRRKVACLAKRKRGILCDRRKFDRANPISVASALHLRQMELVPQDEVPDISDFQKQIYSYFRLFSNGKPVKKSAQRVGIPTPQELYLMDEVTKIVVRPILKTTSKLPVTDKTNPFLDAEEIEQPVAASAPPAVPMDEASTSHQVVEAGKVEGRGRGRSRKVTRRLQRATAAKVRWEKDRSLKEQLEKMSQVERNVSMDHTYCLRSNVVSEADVYAANES